MNDSGGGVIIPAITVSVAALLWIALAVRIVRGFRRGRRSGASTAEICATGAKPMTGKVGLDAALLFAALLALVAIAVAMFQRLSP